MPGWLGSFSCGDEALAGQVGGGGEAAEVGERGIDVDQLGEGGGAFAGGLLAGGGDDQRDAGGFFEDALLLPEAAVLAEVIAVVAVEDDDGFVAELEAVEGVEQLADLLVHEGDRGEIGLAGLALQLFVHVGAAGGERGGGDVVEVAGGRVDDGQLAPAGTCQNIFSARRRACAGGRSRRR